MYVIEKRKFLSKCIVNILNSSKKKKPETVVRAFSGFSKENEFYRLKAAFISSSKENVLLNFFYGIVFVVIALYYPVK